MRVFARIIPVLGATIMLLQGCYKPEEYPIEPRIEFKSFYSPNDTIGFISFSFTDGDGDIGFKEGEEYPPYNVFMTYYEKVNGVWQEGTGQDGNPVPFNYRTAYLTPDGKNKAIRGTIQIEMDWFYYPFSPDNDTVQFKIKLADRAGHMSNEVFSNVIIR